MALTKEKRNLFILVSVTFVLLGVVNLIVFTFFIHASLQKVEKPPAIRILSSEQVLSAKRSHKPRVYFDVSIGGKPEGRLVFNLFYDKTPITAENFRALATGEKGKAGSGVPLSYKATVFHYVIPGFICQGGDVTGRSGMGSLSIYGPTFSDENFEINHTKKGLLSMANKGRNTNGSQFFITLGPAPQLDNKHVVFGEVVEGFDVLEKISQVGSPSGQTSLQVLVIDSGVL